MRRTGAIAVSAGLRLLAVVLVCSITLFLPHLNGTVVGILALGSAFATDFCFLDYASGAILEHQKSCSPICRTNSIQRQFQPPSAGKCGMGREQLWPGGAGLVKERRMISEEKPRFLFGFTPHRNTSLTRGKRC